MDTKTPNQDIAKAINALSQNNFKEAEKICHEILTLGNDSDANYILGCIRMHEKKYNESIDYIKKAISKDNANAGYYISLGCAYSSNKNFTEAIEAFKNANNINSEIPQIHFYLGEAYRQTGQFNKALTHFKKSLDLSPDHIGSLLMLGVVYEELKKFGQAKQSYLGCIDIYPENADPHINLGMCYLLTGEYEKGWKEYEWRLKLDNNLMSVESTKPQWKGENIEGKKLLIICEQGFGDTIHFIRFAKLFSKEGTEIIVLAQDELNSLLEQQAWISNIINLGDEIPEHDFYVYIQSIPGILEWNPTTYTQEFPYISIKESPIKYIEKDKLNIGIATQTRIAASDHKMRSIDLNKFTKIFNKAKHNIISLDYALNQTNDKNEIIDYYPEITDFVDTANIIKNLDLIISVDTVVAHLAGSLNKNVWLLLSSVPGWRWDFNYPDSTPWYPTFKILRQETNDNWNNVLKNIELELKNYV
tara:strand:+ start:464 stop:1888 length:1425 start_codon:yes stop_codon:yes gene_type:complete